MRTVLLWQALLTVAAAMLAAYFSGPHGALSAGLGGAVSMAAGLLFASIATVRRGRTAADVLLTAFKAEGAKLLFIVVALGLVMMAYKNVVAAVLIGTFIATILIQSMAFFVGNKRD
ncbi:MAG TPA: ATP synthase subunit I [Burkholderiales bacterium]